MSNEIQKNVFGEPLEPCSHDPITGWFRDGCCNTDKNDRGIHTVCAKVTDKFLLWSKKVGNDLITPHPEFGFPGLKDGDFFEYHDNGKLKSKRQFKMGMRHGYFYEWLTDGTIYSRKYYQNV